MHIHIYLTVKSALLYQVFYTTLSIILIKIDLVYLKETLCGDKSTNKS